MRSYHRRFWSPLVVSIVSQVAVSDCPTGGLGLDTHQSVRGSVAKVSAIWMREQQESYSLKEYTQKHLVRSLYVVSCAQRSKFS